MIFTTIDKKTSCQDSDKNKYVYLGGNQRSKLKVTPYDCSGSVFLSWTSKKGVKHYKKFRGYYLPKDYNVSSSDKLKANEIYSNSEEANKKALDVSVSTSKSGESSR